MPVANIKLDGGTAFDTVVLVGGAGADAVTVANTVVLFAGAGTVELANIDLVTLDALAGNDTIQVNAVPFGRTMAIAGSSGVEQLNIGTGDLDVAILGGVTVNGATMHVNLVDNNAVGDDDYTISAVLFDKPTMLGYVTYTKAASITLTTSVGENAVFIEQTAAGTQYFINTGGEDDAITVGDGNIANNIDGDLTINAGSGADTLTFADTASTAALRTHTLNSTSYGQTGLVADIDFSLVNNIVLEQNDFAATINVSTTLTAINCDIRGHAGNDTINLTTIPTATVKVDGGTGFDSVALVGGAGNDVVTVNNTSVAFAAGAIELANIDVVSLDGRVGSDTIHVNAVPFGRTVTVSGTSGDDELNIGNGDLDANILGALHASGSAMKVRLLDSAAFGDDHYTFTATTVDKPTLPGSLYFFGVATVTLESSNGSNDIAIEQTAAGTDYFINTGLWHDDVVIGKGDIAANIAGDLTIDGGTGGYNIVTLDNSSNVGLNHVHTVTPTSYTQTGLLATINFKVVNQIELEQGNVAAAIHVNSTEPSVIIEAHGNGGGDTYFVDGAPAGTVRLFGASPTDMARLNGSAGSDTITLTGKSFQYAGAGSVEVNAINVVNLDALGGADLFAYVGTALVADNVQLLGSTVAGSGRLIANGMFVDFQQTESLDARGNPLDADQLTFHGTQLRDRFHTNLTADGTTHNAVLSFQSADQMELLRLLDYRFMSLQLNGNAGNDVFDIYVGPNAPIDRRIDVNGGTGHDRLYLHYLDLIPKLSHQSPAPGQGLYSVQYPKRFFEIGYQGMETTAKVVESLMP